MITKLVSDLTNINIGDILYSLSIGAMIYLIGGKDDILTGLLLFMIFDYITGWIKAIKNKDLNSKKAVYGILKKFVILIIVAMSNRLDIIFHLTEKGLNCRFVVICFYIGSEGLSILENATLIGVPVPVKLKKILEQCKNEKQEKAIENI